MQRIVFIVEENTTSTPNFTIIYW